MTCLIPGFQISVKAIGQGPESVVLGPGHLRVWTPRHNGGRERPG